MMFNSHGVSYGTWLFLSNLNISRIFGQLGLLLIFTVTNSIFLNICAVY